ncbi:MAG: bifunctional folylpolyglutamate synthase/dihydrofolate synthase [Candidatus Cloacimonetes bacterium]|nr:bifunctional folylpolyglutamate synthase/dihydrofolate synthase [Candidatus Cloacimonadota bacterium]
MNYTEFLAHIYQKYSGNVKLELNRMEGVLEDMDQPQQKLRGLHVAGTNGKGSTCASLEALLLSHDVSTGLNTSPHLMDYTERFRVKGRDIDFETILAMYHKYETIFDKWDASFFEITTAIAFQLFVDVGLDTAIMEVGLGGRLDATNLFTPDVCAITTIGLDHVKTLGPSLDLIAREKAGIIKPGIPVVIGDIEALPLKVITDVAESENAPYYVLGRDFSFQARDIKLNGLTFDYHFGDYEYRNLEARLIGAHQLNNLAIALTVFHLYAKCRGFIMDEERIRQGLLNIHWQGRMQIVCQAPLSIVDGAHNVQGIKALRENVRKLFQGKRILFVLSILADKDYKEMIRIICEFASVLYISQNTSDRAATIEQQALEVQKNKVPFVTAESVKDGYQQATRDAGSEDLILAGGSLYTVAEILNIFRC